uniref:RNA polymerase II subunit B1 CTD phosphatase RPAP2 homolog n=1 Tax=Globisporangium ultimum (strain ATCC 200006 / CBS 805.95 / DAOM BR144) TaxID=431595 RepID=K3WPD5_GLOUD
MASAGASSSKRSSAKRSGAPAAANASATPSSSAAATSGSGSNVREAFVLMSSLIYPRIPVRYLDLCAKILQRRHMDTVFEERAVQSLCAFPPCGNKLADKSGKYRISLVRKEIYDAQHENQFCSQLCLKKARVFFSKLVAKPPQLVPSMLEVFGTSRPNPFDFDQPPTQEGEAANDKAKNQTHSISPPPIPKANTVWSKTGDLGIVERKSTPVDALSVPSALTAPSPVALKENETPDAPDKEFPDASHAVLIEGFVFPSHKNKLAKKVEKMLQKDDANTKDEIVVSDSDDESGSDMDSDASSASFALSDFEEDEIISLDELSLFSNLWRLFSTWITHETNLLVAGLPIPPKEENEKVRDDAAARAVRYRMQERINAFALMLNRPMPQVARNIKLAADRYVNQKIADITATFSLRDAIDARNSHQLLALFYELRNDDEAVVDTDVQPLEEITTGTTATDISVNEQPKKCRKCRRSVDKCICKLRASGGKQSDFSVGEVEAMLQEALTLREEYEELLDA